MPLKPGMEYIDKSNERAKKEKKSEEEDAEEGLQNLLPELCFYVFGTGKGLCCRYVFLCFQSIKYHKVIQEILRNEPSIVTL